MTELPVLDHDAVLAAVSPRDGDRPRPRRRSCAIHAGEWVMPPKVYLESPPYGDFRAMPARGDGLALAEVDDLVPRQPRARAADGHRGDLPLGRRPPASR